MGFLFLRQTHYKQKSRIFVSQSRLRDSKPHNNVLHAFCGIETIELPLRSSHKKSVFEPRPAPSHQHYGKAFIMRLPCAEALFLFPNNKKITIIIFMATQHKTIDQQTLENLLYLSRLSPDSTDMETLKKQVDDIVGYFDILAKYDDSENPYDAYPSTEVDKLRDDTVVQGLDINDVKKVTDEFMDGYFQVPKVLGAGA